MINVANGISRVQVNSTSLQNYANADRIGTLVDQTLSMGVPASKTTVLVYYTGQLALVSHKIQATAEANGRNWDLSAGNQISSVDSFQGEENEFVFVDLVVAHQRPEKTSDAVKDEESEDDDGSDAPGGLPPTSRAATDFAVHLRAVEAASLLSVNWPLF